MHDKQHDDGCTYTDFQEFLDCNADKGSQTDVEHADFTGYRHCASITSPFAEQLQDALKKIWLTQRISSTVKIGL